MDLTNTSVRKRIAVGAITGLVVVGGALGVSGYASGDDDTTQQRTEVVTVADVDEGATTTAYQLSHESALQVLEAAQAKAGELEQRVTIAIVDRAGNTIALIKGDGAGPQSADSAIAKAYTSAAWGQPTSGLTDAATGDGPSIDDIPNTLFLPGGVPITVDGTPIAGIGVGGAPSGDIDEEIALAGLEALELG
ncbi:uncharacterized protein GlcG (DUF336 family) [Stackebrandtia endophytica]|uniref:Uncharacterized protein GlcG (DUF336 family) n=1 Tax=Stackebrandtia endophytica TaxID=1496996 RepID=A0A543AZL9_9ACTN|nr:heme-binding protein [Stackebrandtia endophytica]TQL78032.1 uncharacterized protein GlcG (DUF336 family) [Stackebrandtia endophytica]